MDEYDKNKDGKLDEAELEKCPALRSALAQIAGPDKNYIEQDDLVKRLEKFQKSRTALSMVICRVTARRQRCQGCHGDLRSGKIHGRDDQGGVGRQ